VQARFVDSPDGIRLAYESGGTAGPSLLFLHGWSCDRSYFAPQMSHFAKDHTVVAPDLRGHGDSGRPDPKIGRYDMNTLVDDVLAVARDAGLDQPVVLGHSLGASIALACAQRVDAIRAAVLVDPAPMFPGMGKDYLTAAAAATAQDLDGAWRRGNANMLFLPTDTVRRTEIVDQMTNSLPASVAAALMETTATFDGAAALAQTTVPVLAITSAEPESGLREYSAMTLGRTVGSGHFIQLEVPEQVNPMIERFLTVAGLKGAGNQAELAGRRQQQPNQEWNGARRH
jgi:pimeloyl-ACP methyl ester carboxylesterase